MKHESTKAGKAHPHAQDEVWSIEGVFKHLIYGPRGEIGGCVIDADGVMVQFVFDHGGDNGFGFKQVVPGQVVTVEGIEAKPWPQGDMAHAVYQFKRLAGVDGAMAKAPPPPGHTEGKVVRMNYARHGEPNGVVLDSGDFVHVRPDRFGALDIALGAHVKASGPAHRLADGSGHAIDAVEVNGTTLAQ